MKKIYLLLLVVGFSFVSQTGYADLTSPILPGPETPLSTILNTLYGAGNYVRVDDYNAAITDQMWFNPNGSAAAQAKYAGYSQDFGIYRDTNNDGILDQYHSLFSVTTNGYLSGSPTQALPIISGGYLFSFYDDPSGAPLWNSITGMNSDQLDHMVTFYITTGASKGNYVIAFEDLVGLGDKDYNDLVVEVKGVRPVPEPATMIISALTLIGAGGFVRRKFFKQV